MAINMTHPVKQQPTLRFAAGPAAANYPLPVQGPIQWQHHQSVYTATVAIGECTAGELVLPSFVLLDQWPYEFQFSLKCRSGHSSLNPVGTLTPLLATSQVLGLESCVDVFLASQAQSEAILELRVRCAAPPANYLLTLSRRPARLSQAIDIAPRLPQLEAAGVPQISQMCQSPQICNHTCSPTSLLMLMQYSGTASTPETEAEFIASCLDPATGIYGVWPRNLMMVARRGLVGGVELFSNWQQLKTVADPFIASIRFATGELTGSPLAATEGHLLVVTGSKGARIYCNDPAAANTTGVATSYDAQEFQRAWLCDRGVAYIVAPTQN
jgi:hypothetical protein